jgi:hypothetical protein
MHFRCLSIHLCNRESKRKKSIDLSSDEDEESDYAPSEPVSPSANKSTRQTKDVSVVKKCKLIYGYGFASKVAPRVETVQGKNEYGFRSTPIPKPRLLATIATPPSTTGTESAQSTPTDPNKSSLGRFTTSAPSQSPYAHRSRIRPPTTVTQAKSKVAPAPKNIFNKKPVLQPGRRLAALAAENKIHGYFEKEKEFMTECVIEEADQMEDVGLPEAMHRMSIPPSPQRQDVQSDVENDASAEVLIDTKLHTPRASSYRHLNTANSHVTAKARRGKSWTNDRVNSDRHLARRQTMVEDDDSELAISECISVDGIIVRIEQLEDLDLMSDV